MRALALFAALFFSSANAQYFSAGWTPGQPVEYYKDTQSKTTTAAAKPTSIASIKQVLIDTVLNSNAVSSLSNLVGVNISEKVNHGVSWDERIPLITDENYAEIIVNEQLTEEEEKDRVWFLIITVTTGQPDGVSQFVDDVFDATYNLTQELGDLPHVRFGRIDYLNVTAITTKWAVWSAPYLVVLKHRGQTLRFYRSGKVRLSDEILHAFLKEEAWQQKDPWKSIYGPGGEREYILDYFAIIFTKVYAVVVLFPRWLLYIVTGGAASLIVNWLHRDKGTIPIKATSQRPVSTATAEPVAAAPATAASPSASQVTKRKKGGGKK